MANAEPRRGACSRARWRRPGGLKIQTIHGFCARLLQQFPFEAHVAARFRVLDETQQRQLLERLRLSVLLEAAAKPDGALGRALAAATTAASDFAFKDALDEAIGKRDEVMAFVDAVGGTDGIRPHLSQSLGVSAADSIEEIEREIVDGPLNRVADWSAVADACAEGSSQDQDQSARLRRAIDAVRDGASRQVSVGLHHRQRGCARLHHDGGVA